MKLIKSDKAGTPVGYALVAGLGLGLSYGIIAVFQMSLFERILSTCAVLAIAWALFRTGKKAAYSEAQAWAQNEVNVAVEVYNQATAKAEALSEAYATAISSANASAVNNITIELPNGEKKTLTQHEFEGIINASRDAQPPRVSMGDELSEESTSLWSRPNS
jgi:hypothetical protein